MNTWPTRYYLLHYSPICLPYWSHIDRRKPTIYAADHKQGVHGHLLWYGHRSGSRCPASTIGCGGTNMVLLTHLSVQPWQAHKTPLMFSCLGEWIRFFKRFIHRGEKIKINGFLCSATVCNCLSEGDCLQPGTVIYANVTWKRRNEDSENYFVYRQSQLKWKSIKAEIPKKLRRRARGNTDEAYFESFLAQICRCISPLWTVGGDHALTQIVKWS